MTVDNSGAAVQRCGDSPPEADIAPVASDPVDAASVPQDSAGAACADATPAGGDAAAPKPTPPATRREFEHALRSLLGYSKRQAAAIAAEGFKARSADEDEGPHRLEALVHALKQGTGAAKGNT